MKKILVAGGAGYIGSHVVLALLNNGFKVRVFDNFSTGQDVNLFPEAEVVKGDILDFEALKKAMQGVDAVVHLAAKKAVGESMENPNLYSFNNLIGSLNILAAMVDCGVKHIVFSSTAAVYGMPQYLPIDEKHPLNPMNYYGFTKLEIEKFMAWYDELKGVKFMALRYFNAVGYDKDGRVKGREQGVQNLLPVIMEAAAGKRKELKVFGTDYETRDGTCIRDYIHVSDLASAHVLALQKLFGGYKSEIINLGTGIGTSVKEMIDMVEEVLGRKIAVVYEGRRAGDPAELYATSAKAKEVLGWEPAYRDIRDIVKTVV